MNKKQSSIMLFASVLINVFLLGIVISCHVIKPDRPHGPPPPHMQGPLPQFEAAKEKLSPESQTIVEAIMARQGEALRGDTRAIRRNMREAERLLTAPTLDKAALEKIHQDMDSSNVAMKSALSNMIYQIATELPDEERIQFFKQVLPKHPNGGPPPPKKGNRP